MLPPLHGILHIGVSSLKAHQTALATTAHNISNVNTEGYTRQRVGLEAERPLPITPGQLGLGVKVTDIRRMRDLFLDGSVRLQTAQQARYQFSASNLEAIETALGSAEGGLNSALTDFFNGFHDLSTAPEDMGVRRAVIDRGQILAGAFRNADTALVRSTASVDFTVDQSALDINSMLDRVAILNREIQKAELGTDNANDFRDQRDLLVDKLSAYFDLSVVEQPSGVIDITVNGEALVTGYTTFPVQVVGAGVPPHPQIQSSGGVSLVTTGGKLRGIGEVYQTIDDLRASADDLAATLIAEVNARHSAGFDLTGAAGGDFFTGSDAATIDVDAALRSSPARLVAAGVAAPGDNQVALQMVALQDLAVYPGGTPTETLNEAARNIIIQLGSQTRGILDLAKTYTDGLKLANDQRQSVSGVNMDEEVTNLMAYQRAYEASARMITAIDEAMDLIINRMGRVGL